MKNFLALILLLVPFVVSAQATPQLQVSSLSTERYEYGVGQEIKGSFNLNNIGEADVPDLQYYIAVGNYGEKGGILQNEVIASPLSEILYLPKSESKTIPFSITPEKIPTGLMGLHVVVTQKNGMILGWSKIPLQISGGTTELVTLEGLVVVDEVENPLLAGPTATKDSVAFVALRAESFDLNGSKDFQLTIFDRQFEQEVVFDEVVKADFVEGVAKITLPTNLSPESYAGEVRMVGGSNTVKFRYIIAGPQAEILEVSSDKLSLKKNDSFILKLSYSDTPLDIANPTATVYPENLSVRLKITNSKGEVVDEYNGPLDVGVKKILSDVDETSDDMALDIASDQLDAMINNAYEVEIPLVAQSNAKNLSFFIELYDSGTGEVFDSYITELPSEQSVLNDILILIAIIVVLIILIFIFVKTKHKIPTVCIALILGSLFSAHVIIQRAEALVVLKTGWKNGDLVFAQPISSRVGGYEPGATLPVDVTYGIWACANNGLMNMHIAVPKLNTWHSYKTAQDAVTSATAELKGVQNAWYLANFNPTADDKYLEKYYISDSELSFQKSFSQTQSLKAPTTPGMHYMPAAAWYCTSSHGCAKPTIIAYEICVNGAGVCPGETVTDACTNITGNQASVPSGYTADAGVCTLAPTCNDEHYQGQVSCLVGQEIVWSCELNESGESEYTGSWEYSPTGETCGSGLDVSCVADPITIKPGESTTFRSTVQNPKGTITYNWESNGTIVGTDNVLSRSYGSVGSYLVDLDIKDSANNAVDSTSCRVTVSNCDNSHNGETSCKDNGDKTTWVCTAAGWEEQVTGTCSTVSADPTIKKYEFNPNIIAAGGECKLTLEAENVSACRLYKGGVDAGYTIPMTSLTSINTTGVVGVAAGSYTLSCTGAGENPTTGFYGTKQCLTNFDIRED